MKQLTKIIEDYKILGTNNTTPKPTNWQDGFKNPSDPNTVDTPLRLMSGEEPFQVNGQWYVYVWDEGQDDIVVYDFSTDIAIPYMDFQKRIGMLAECRIPSWDALFSILGD